MVEALQDQVPDEKLDIIEDALKRTMTMDDIPDTDADTPFALTYRGITLSTLLQKVRYLGAAQKLSAREFAVLRLFMEQPEQEIATEYIHAQVWGDNSQLQNVTVTMHRLRAKLSRVGVRHLLNSRRGSTDLPGYWFGSEPPDGYNSV